MNMDPKNSMFLKFTQTKDQRLRDLCQELKGRATGIRKRTASYWRYKRKIIVDRGKEWVKK